MTLPGLGGGERGGTWAASAPPPPLTLTKLYALLPPWPWLVTQDAADPLLSHCSVKSLALPPSSSLGQVWPASSAVGAASSSSTASTKVHARAAIAGGGCEGSGGLKPAG